METSNKLKAYLEQIESGKIVSDMIRILETAIKHPVTIETFLKANMKHQVISARLSELEELGALKKLANPLNNYSIYVYISDPKEQELQRQKVWCEKQKAFLKRGEKMGFLKFDNNNFEYSVV